MTVRVYLHHMEMHPRFDQYDAIFGDDPQAYQEFLEALEATLAAKDAELAHMHARRIVHRDRDIAIDE